jgi:hypothetical protein
MLTLLEQQLATAVTTPGRLDSIRLNDPGKGTPNGSLDDERSIILVDPNDFLSITTSTPRFNSGTVALRIAHEIGHTLDPAGEVNVVNYTDPLAYASARSRLEGFAVVTELGVYDDWAKNETNPYRSSYLSIDANQGNRTLAITFSEIKIKGKENGLSQEHIDTQ